LIGEELYIGLTQKTISFGKSECKQLTTTYNNNNNNNSLLKSFMKLYSTPLPSFYNNFSTKWKISI
jgi:hypothetical protein